MPRVISEGLEKIIDKEFKVLDKGFIRVVDYMGDDFAITQAARVSYGAGTKTVNSDKSLINYLLSNKHTSPFEMCEIKFHVKMPIFVARQWLRHRMASVNEYSARYSEIKDEFYVPDLNRLKLQSQSNKQCSDDQTLSSEDGTNFINMSIDHNEYFLEYYKLFNEKGLARELNRINAPVSNYTEFYWKIDLHNLLHFIKLRIHPHAQEEIREYAEVLLDIVKEWCPMVHEAFVNYSLNEVKFSSVEFEALLKSIDKDSFMSEINNLLEQKKISKREYNELLKKLDK